MDSSKFYEEKFEKELMKEKKKVLMDKRIKSK